MTLQSGSGEVRGGAILRFMIPLGVDINYCELAERFLETSDREKFPALVKSAQELIRAQSECKDMSNLKSPAGIKVAAAIEAFVKKYKSYCEKYDRDNPTP